MKINFSSFQNLYAFYYVKEEIANFVINVHAYPPNIEKKLSIKTIDFISLITCLHDISSYGFV